MLICGWLCSGCLLAIGEHFAAHCSIPELSTASSPPLTWNHYRKFTSQCSSGQGPRLSKGYDPIHV